MSDMNERLAAHAQFALGILASSGAEFARPLYQDWDNAPCLIGTVTAVTVRDSAPLAGVTPVDENGKPVKGGRQGIWELEVRPVDGAPLAVSVMSASLRKQLQHICPNYAWDERTMTPDAMAKLDPPPLAGMHLAIVYSGRWTDGDKSGDRFVVASFPSADAAAQAWIVYAQRIRERRRGVVATTHAGQLESDPNADS